MHKLIAVLLLVIGVVEAQDNVVHLDYGSFLGHFDEQYNYTTWQKIPYAAPPTGQNRFRAPQPPVKQKGLYDSREKFSACPQGTSVGSEDCLYLGLFSRPWTEGQPLRPTVVVFHGGGFVGGSGSFGTPPTSYPILNVSESDMMFVYPHYRLNAFGFLAGVQVKNDPTANFNVGLLDQRACLKWVQRYGRSFGGDPSNVTIWGQSAGGGSVIAQIIAKQERPSLFHKAAASSPCWPKVYRWNSTQAQGMYDELASLAGCIGPNSLGCLRNISARALQNASFAVQNQNLYTTSTYNWGPVLDDSFLPKSLSQRTDSPLGHLKTAFTVYTTNDAKKFIPTGLGMVSGDASSLFNSSDASFDQWLKGFLPGLSSKDRQQVKTHYPPDGSTETISYSNNFDRASLIYRDSILACPALWISASATNEGWLTEYAVSPAGHAQDGWWWNSVTGKQYDDVLKYKTYVGAFKSYFSTGDPNQHRLTELRGPPVLERLAQQEWVVEDSGFRASNISQLQERCKFWRSMAGKIPL
ncbi:Carboxylesterase patB [Colletotrichum fructicola]|nr:Carboxylesterase patB [Colletotrichum fructicola]